MLRVVLFRELMGNWLCAPTESVEDFIFQSCINYLRHKEEASHGHVFGLRVSCELSIEMRTPEVAEKRK
jgi:hypothetical protein